jgi:hypothetical protein
MNLEVPKQGVVMYCPECRHEVFLSGQRDVHCGLCKMRYGRDVRMLLDPRAGDLLGELEKPDPAWVDFKPEE